MSTYSTECMYVQRSQEREKKRVCCLAESPRKGKEHDHDLLFFVYCWIT